MNVVTLQAVVREKIIPLSVGRQKTLKRAEACVSAYKISNTLPNCQLTLRRII